jgi:methyltransferase (TIGR00027 family)
MNSGPSRTSQAVALTRARLDRPHSQHGDPAAQRALCAGLNWTPPDWMQPSIEARTKFMDDLVIAAIARGVRQIVVCGAGLDDRALRFRTPGVRFFEVDHPVTQADKAMRLRDLGAAENGPVLVACDFQADSVADALAARGHLSHEDSLFVCEGLLVYLDEQACGRLLAGLAACAGAAGAAGGLESGAPRPAGGSVLSATLATHSSDAPAAEVVAEANARRRAAASEPWRTILPADEHLAMLSATGWMVTSVTELPTASGEVSFGRKSLLVTAVPAGRR